MAIDAPAHFQFLHGYAVFPMAIRHEVELVQLLDRTMTALAFEPGLDMPIVTKLNVFGQAVDLHPFDGFFLFPMLLENANALDFVVGRRKLRVTAHADFNRGNASGSGAIRTGMAILAVHLELTRVVFVTEGNRLNGPRCLGVPGESGALASAPGRPLASELGGNFNPKRGIALTAHTQFVGLADTSGHQNIPGRHRGMARIFGPSPRAQDGRGQEQKKQRK